MRFIKEFKNPVLRCARTGHVEKEITRTGVMEPYKWKELGGSDYTRRAVGVKFKRILTICNRCRKSLGAPEYKYITYLTSISWPSPLMDQFREDGVIYD